MTEELTSKLGADNLAKLLELLNLVAGDQD
jgi:hypothetical protein